MDVQYECDNAFPNPKCVPEPFPGEKSIEYRYKYEYKKFDLKYKHWRQSLGQCFSCQERAGR